MNVDWNQLRLFSGVASAGSFTGAGKAVGLSQSAVSRQISSLETDLGITLFWRHAGGIALTEPGTELLDAVNDMSSRLSSATGRINEYREKPEGPLRITTTLAFGSGWLSARINKFLKAYPEIAVSLILVDNIEMDLCQGEADVAIRFACPTQPSLVQLKLMKIRYHVFASKGYINSFGIPKSSADLDNHKLIVYGDDVPAPIEDINWLLFAGSSPDAPRTPALRVNSIHGIYRAVSSGLGIAALPFYLIEESSDLVEILKDIKGPYFEAYFVYREELRNSKRIQVLRDFLSKETKK